MFDRLPVVSPQGETANPERVSFSSALGIGLDIFGIFKWGVATHAPLKPARRASALRVFLFLLLGFRFYLLGQARDKA